jgi:tripartite-type tricarboxylate transporter receptor subunit TctC
MLKNAIRVVALAMALAASAAQAQSYPVKPVKVLVGFGAGGATDLIARVMSDEVSKRLGQAFVIENRPGASGLIAAQAVKNSPPDGYTLYSGSTTPFTTIFMKDNPMDAAKELTPVSVLAVGDEFIFVRADLGINSLKDFIAKAKTTRLKHASPATTQNLLMAVFAKQGGFDYDNIPFKTTDQVITSLLNGECDFSYTSLPGFAPHLQSGKIKAIAATWTERSPLLPNVPTAREQGVDMVFRFNLGYWAPPGTPRDVVAKIGSAVADAVKSQQAQEKIGAVSMIPLSSSPDGLVKIFQNETQTYTEAAKLTNYQPQ